VLKLSFCFWQDCGLQEPLKVDFGGRNYRIQASHVASHVDSPSRTLLTVRPARQDGVRPAALLDNYVQHCPRVLFLWYCIRLSAIYHRLQTQRMQSSHTP